MVESRGLLEELPDLTPIESRIMDWYKMDLAKFAAKSDMVDALMFNVRPGRSKSVAAYHKQMLGSFDIEISAYDEHGKIDISKAAEYLEAERNECMKLVCAHCRSGVQYVEHLHRHVRGGTELPCRAQAMRDRRDPLTLLRNMHHDQRAVWANEYDKQHRKQMQQAMYAKIYGNHHDMAEGFTLVVQACDACKGSGVYNKEECWHCGGEGVDPTK